MVVPENAELFQELLSQASDKKGSDEIRPKAETTAATHETKKYQAPEDCGNHRKVWHATHRPIHLSIVAPE